jgi:hypothetical protein
VDSYRDFRLSQATTQTNGFHSANNAMDSFVTDTADAFANLATATASDRKLMADLAASNQTLLAQLASKDNDISKLQAQLVETTRRAHAHAAITTPTTVGPTVGTCTTTTRASLAIAEPMDTNRLPPAPTQ